MESDENVEYIQKKKNTELNKNNRVYCKLKHSGVVVEKENKF